jgi:predicted dehydrogenase
MTNDQGLMRASDRKPVTIGLIGVGGYGRVHLQAIRRAQDRGLVRLVAAVILPGQEEDTERELRALGVLIYRSHEEMLARAPRESGDGMELVGVPCGIGQHAPLSIAALRAGYHVLCEKPAAGNHREALAMLRAARETGKILAIGYQNMYTPMIRRIKELTLEGWGGGVLGRLLTATCSARWPRGAAYYGRNEWAGHLTAEGREIFDSPVQNALAHYLQDMLFVAGPDARSCATPVRLYGENYRAKAIESADTQFLRIGTREGPTLVFMATHACSGTQDPIVEYAYERGTITWRSLGDRGRIEVRDAADGRLTGTFDDGPGNPQELPYLGVIEALREGGSPITTIENCVQHALCVDRLFRGCGVTPIAGSSTDTGSSPTAETHITGIDRIMDGMFAEGRSFFEVGAPWAVPGKDIDLER